MRPDENAVAFIAMEAGASWPAWLSEGDGCNVCVEAALGTEAPNEFATRVVQRLLQIESRTGTPVQAVIATNGSTDPPTAAARARVAQAIASSMSAAGQGELVIAADDNVADGARAQLFELAGELCEEHAELRVRVRFVPPESRSGVVAAAASKEESVGVSSA